MKIENKIILSNVVNIGLILLIGFFALEKLNLMQTKLRFVEIADDLNATFLEMRLTEKNYFINQNRDLLIDIQDKIQEAEQSLDIASKDIIRSIGENKYVLLKSHLKQYSDIVNKVRQNPHWDTDLNSKLGAEGKMLREFSKSITSLERNAVNDIISRSKFILLYSFFAILICAVTMSHFISRKILLSLREIEKLAKSISKGNFKRIEGAIPDDEFGSVMAAINSMSEELMNREDALVQSKKLASLGILTAGVAHELTNPLNNISMIAQTFTEMYDNLGKAQIIECMDNVEKETERIMAIIKNLIDFSKPKEAHLKETDINTVMQKTLKLMQNMLDISNIDTKLNLVPDLPHVLIDEDQIMQVMVNLITNAIQSMQAGKSLFLATRLGKSGDSVEIQVMDTGQGIPREFLPTYSTRSSVPKERGGQGSGFRSATELSRATTARSGWKAR